MCNGTVGADHRFNGSGSEELNFKVLQIVMVILVDRNGDEVLLRVTYITTPRELNLVVDHKHGYDQENREAELQRNKDLSGKTGPFTDGGFSLQYFYRLERRQIKCWITSSDNSGNDDQSHREKPELLTGIVNK